MITKADSSVAARHDYKPFGEEVSMGQGLRSTTLGYGAVDGIRQKFTQQERDNETGLDYMHARYFASAQGRFSSADTLKEAMVTVGPKRLCTERNQRGF